ncbi:non-hydrolyzing UDP-N-acetylglucosamine 2-epimerase [Chloroflexota bacterium]
MKIVLVAGARPNFMKIAPIMREIEKHNLLVKNRSIEPILVHTGQHYDYEMSKVFFEDLELPDPDIYLGVGSGTHAEQTGKVMIEIEKMLINLKPDLLLVVGDVNSTLAGALAAVKLHIPIAHIEAGIRTYDRAVPEEVNRYLTDHVSDYLFTTSEYDDENLLKEGISNDRIYRVGNIMADSLFFNKEIASRSDILSRLGLVEKGYALLTLHRPSNVDNAESLSNILEAVNGISNKIPIVFPVHPRTRKNIDIFGLGHIYQGANNRLKLIQPLGYLDFLNLEMNSQLVITDSGGIQVETTILGISCLTLLELPAWTITHDKGTNILVGSNGNKLVEEAFKIIDGKSRKGQVPELWDGKAAERTVKILSRGLV